MKYQQTLTPHTELERLKSDLTTVNAVARLEMKRARESDKETREAIKLAERSAEEARVAMERVMKVEEEARVASDKAQRSEGKKRELQRTLATLRGEKEILLNRIEALEIQAVEEEKLKKELMERIEQLEKREGVTRGVVATLGRAFTGAMDSLELGKDGVAKLEESLNLSVVAVGEDESGK
ncbi:hypothetical protein HDV00_005477 [Rhizophlyctis rosea]|nr:hypothetical protein HDV00_005477 [Rhizophlyctis rosea]